MRAPVVFVGQPGTTFEVKLHDSTGQDALRLTGEIPVSHTQVIWVELPTDFPVGLYTYSLRIRKPQQDWITIPDTATPTGDRATLRVDACQPDLHAAEAFEWANPPRFEDGQTNWGLSEY